jgi:hypothetical protein
MDCTQVLKDKESHICMLRRFQSLIYKIKSQILINLFLYFGLEAVFTIDIKSLILTNVSYYLKVVL